MFTIITRQLRVASVLLATSLSLFQTTPAAAAGGVGGFPDKPVSIIVPTTPGGTADILARLVGPKLAEKWKQPVVVENKPGAGTLIGSEYVARAKPDGYTLMLSFNELATLPALNKDVKLNVDSLTRVGQIGSLPVLVLTNPKIESNNLKELIALFKASPGKYTYSSNGAGSSLQLFTELFKREAGVDVLHIPYRGALEASMAAIAGEVDLLVQFASGNVLNHVKAGKLKAYAVASDTRLAGLPDVPTAAEAGLPGLRLQAWYGLFAPAGTPDALVQKINKDLNEALALPDIQERLKGINLQPTPSTPADFDRYFRAESERWAALIKAAGIQSNQ